MPVLDYNRIPNLYLTLKTTQLHAMVCDIDSMSETTIFIARDPQPHWNDRFGSFRAPFRCHVTLPNQLTFSRRRTPYQEDLVTFAACGPYLALDDFELDLIALLQALVTLRGNRPVVDEHVRSIVAARNPYPFALLNHLTVPFKRSMDPLLQIGAKNAVL